MIVLALDTSTTAPVVALGGPLDSSVVASRRELEPSRQGRRVVALIREALGDSAPVTPDLIGVGLGPGSFTGLRVGLIACKALAYAWDRPLVGFDSLAAIAAGADWAGEAIVAVDAQRGGLYTASFRRDRPGEPPVAIRPTEVVDAAAWADRATACPLVLTPDPDRLQRLTGGKLVGTRVARAFPTPEAILHLTRAARLDGAGLDPFFAEPNYGRPSAAEEKAEATGR